MLSMTTYLNELETITGKAYRGDLTPVVYDLLQDSPNLRGLYEYLTGVKYNNDFVDNTDTDTREEVSDRPCFEKWFSQCQKL